MSAKYTFLAWDTPITNAPLKLTLLQLANNADDAGFSYYSISKMAESCGMSQRTFMRKIVELEKLNMLNVERRPNRPSLYSLVGDEMGVTLCHLQNTEVTESHPEVTESHLVGDSLSPDLNNTPDTSPESISNKLFMFVEFWDMYGKKVGRPKCEALWKKLKGEDVALIFETLPSYILSKADKQFRKDPERWLKHECWNDEVITNENRTNTSTGRKESSHERIKRENAVKYGGQNESGLRVARTIGHMGGAVDTGEGIRTIEPMDRDEPFVDY